MSRSWLQDFSLGSAVALAGVSIALRFLEPEAERIPLIKFAFIASGLFFFVLGVFIMVRALVRRFKVVKENLKVNWNCCNSEAVQR